MMLSEQDIDHHVAVVKQGMVRPSEGADNFRAAEDSVTLLAAHALKCLTSIAWSLNTLASDPKPLV